MAYDRRAGTRENHCDNEDLMNSAVAGVAAGRSLSYKAGAPAGVIRPWQNDWYTRFLERLRDEYARFE